MGRSGHLSDGKWAAVLRVGVCLAAVSGHANFLDARELCTVMDKEALARRLEPIGKELADWVRLDTTRVDQFDTPFFTRGGVYRVIHSAKYNPVVFTLGCADEVTEMLPRNPAGFMRLAGHAGLSLNSPEQRIAYVRVFLESTQDQRGRFQILGNVGEIRLIAKPSEEETSHYRRLQEDYDAVIKPPAVGDGPPWEVTLFSLIGQNLVQLKVKLLPDGQVAVVESVLEQDLPIAYVR